MHLVDDRAAYWDRYATTAASQSPEDALKNAFGWTQYDDHGPGEELLGRPSTALELGSGTGDAVAALAVKGVNATGVDISPVHTAEARNRWRHLPNAHFVTSDVLDFLTHADHTWDAIYSIWGAVWFTDPEALLPAVYNRLGPGGKLVFSHAPPVPGSYGIQGMYGNGFKGRQTWIYRWAYEPRDWADLLRRHGFIDINARVEPAPDPENVGTLIVEAHREFPRDNPSVAQDF